MKFIRFTFLMILTATLALGQSNPGWQVAPQESDPGKIADLVQKLSVRGGAPAGLGKGSFAEPEEGLSSQEAALSLSRATEPEEGSGPIVFRTGPVGNEADEITPEIQALARGLRNDPLRIFEYVHNYIGYECYYGSKKGAHMTLLEGSGNDMDQAALLVALLRAAGHTASYAHGPCVFPLSVFPSWWGFSTTPFSYMTDTQFAAMASLTDTSPANIARWRLRLAVSMTSTNAGYYIAEPFSSGGTEYVSIPYTFVEFTTGGTTYNLSPAYKSYSRVNGLNLQTATQYNRANLLSSAGGTTGTPDWVTGLSESGIATRLNTYTNNFRDYLRGGARHELSVKEILGGRRISKVGYNSWGDVLTMIPDPGATWGTMEYSNNIWPAKMSKLEIKAGTYNATTDTFSSTLYTKEITMPSLGGRKLSLSFSGNAARIYLDETLQGSTFTANTGTSFDLRLKVIHNHKELSWSGSSWVSTPVDHDQAQTAKYKNGSGYVYGFPYSFGNPDKLLRKRQEQLDTYRRSGVTDWRATSEGMNILGLTYFKQVWNMKEAVSPLYQILPMTHHIMGRAAQEDAFYVDIGLNYTAPIHYDLNNDVRTDHSGMTMLYASAMEHGVIEQTQGSNALATSTVRLVQKANADGTRIYRATSANKATVLGQLQNYSTTTKNELSALLAASGDYMLLPRTALITVGEWTGGGYAFENATNFRMIIGQGLNGGYSAWNDLDYSILAAVAGYSSDPALALAMSSYFADASYTPYATKMQYSWDPVEMASGAYVMDKSDLSVGTGDAPLGLVFSRQYHSNTRYDDTAGIGYGWTHNNNIFVTERSAPEALMGAANGYQMTSFITAALAAKDLHTNHANAKEWATSALVVHWALEQLKYSAVSVTMGNQSLQFVKMPDGSYEGPPGINFTLTKNGSNNYVLTERNGDTLTFNADKKLATIKNPNGATQTFTYNGSGQLTSVKDYFDRTLTFTWGSGRISSVSDGTGRSVSFAYTNGDMTSFTDPESKVWTYQYDTEHRMVSLKDPDNRFLAENEYDGDSRVTKQRSMGDANREWTYQYTGYANTEINPLGGKNYYFHDERGRSVGNSDDLGNLAWRAYDGQDRKIYETSPKGDRIDWYFDVNNNVESEQDQELYWTDYYYDGQLRLEEVVDKRGNSTTFTYTANHQLATVTDQSNNTTTYTYLGNGLISTATDPEGKTTTNSYDTNGSVNKVTSHDGAEQKFTNNARGDALTSTDGEGRTTTFTWDRRRQLLTTTLPAVVGQPTAVTTNTYDNCGNLATSTDAKGHITSYTYNALGKPLTRTLPALPAGNNVLTTTYDFRDWAITSSNSLGHTTTSEFDSAGRVKAVVDPLSRRSENTYDANGRATETKDALNRTTKFVWSKRGESKRATNPLNHNVDGTFDGNGNQTILKNRRGKNFTTTYDGSNRPSSTTTPTGKTSTMTYFGNNQVKTITEPSGQPTTMAYNGKNLLSSKTDPTGAITYAYDDSGLLETVTEGSAVLHREYDGRGRMTKFTTADGDEIGYQYDAAGNVTRLTYPDGKQVNYTYNSRNLLDSVTDWSGRVTLYSYDRLGKTTGITRAYNGTSTSMTYDAGGQLLERKETSSGRVLSYLRFDHDAGGQIQRRFRAPLVNSGWQTPQVTATYDDDNRLLTFNGQGITHDADGNMTYGPISPDSGSVNLTYNSRNQLVNAGGVSYTYDAEGRRRTITDSNGAAREVIDPNGDMSRLLVRHNLDGSKTFYVYGQGLLYEVDEADSTKTYHFDQIGSTILRTDGTGKEIGWAEYSPYGQVVRKSGDMATPFLYNGQWGISTDSNGLLHMRARYFSPHLMRFLNADPIGFSGGLNWFAYADGDPISKSDPFGLWGWKNFSGALKAVGGVFEVVAGTALATATGVTGVGLVAGIAVAVHGVDTIQSGLRQAFSGEQTDSFTSKGLQAAGMTQTQANLTDAAIGIVGSVGTSLASNSLRGAGAMVHLTNEAAAANIVKEGVLRGNNFAGPASNATSGAMMTLQTGLSGTKVAVPIPAAAQAAFQTVRPIGPLTSWQAAYAQAYTAKGSLDLATGVLTRSGINTTEAFWYSLDTILNGVRIADALK